MCLLLTRCDPALQSVQRQCRMQLLLLRMCCAWLGLCCRPRRAHQPGLPSPVLSWPPHAGYLTQSIGMLTADASRGAFLSGFTVVVVPLMAGLCGTAKLKRSTWVAVGAALVGISLLEDSGAPASWGDFWSFASAVLFGAQVCGSGLAVLWVAVGRRRRL